MKQAFLNLFRKHSIDPQQTRLEIIGLVNEERRKAGLLPLRTNDHLRLAATNHAEDMHKRGYFSHTTPEGLDYVDRIRAANYFWINQQHCGCKTIFNVRSLIEKNRNQESPGHASSDLELCGCQPSFSVGENIAKGQLTPLEVMRDWMNSPGHRKNILHPQYEEIGIGLFGPHWVQNFGRMRIER